MPLDAAVQSVTATLNYLGPIAEKPTRYVDEPPAGRPRWNGAEEPHEVPIIDGRGRAGAGFTVGAVRCRQLYRCRSGSERSRLSRSGRRDHIGAVQPDASLVLFLPDAAGRGAADQVPRFRIRRPRALVVPHRIQGSD